MPINFNNKPSESAQPQQKKPTIQFELTRPLYALNDLVLPAHTQNELQKVIALRQYQKEIFQDWGFAETHKYDNKMIINLYGESGTGKTMAAHAIAQSLGKNLIIVNYGDIESKYVGEPPKNIQAAFEFAKQNGAILFFDEADAILSRRVTNMTSATDTSVNQTRSVMLTLLNDYNDTVLFATNFISNYDPAFMRRILMHIEFTLPDENTRKALFQKYIPSKLPHQIELNELAQKSEKLSGSDIANAMLLSAFAVKSEGRTQVTNQDILAKVDAIQKSKIANAGGILKVETKEVSEDYVNQQLSLGGNK